MVRVLAALAMAMTIGTFALKFFESASPLPVTWADLSAMLPQTDFRTQAPVAEWKNIVVFTYTDGDVTDKAHFTIETRNGRLIVHTTDLWRQQTPTPAARRDLACIAVGIRGDFSKKPPTVAQMDELANLTCMLQHIGHVPHPNVRLHNPGDAFPREKFSAKLLK